MTVTKKNHVTKYRRNEEKKMENDVTNSNNKEGAGNKTSFINMKQA